MAVKKEEKKVVVDDIIDSFKQELNHQDIVDPNEFISTGSSLLDYAISNRPNGGIPTGRIIEIIGDRSSGKTLLACQIIANCQKKGGIGVYIDMERSCHREFMTRLGVDFDRLVTPKVIPTCIEEVFDFVVKVVNVTKQKCAKTKIPVVIVWDSVAATQAKEDVEIGNDGTSRIAPEARALSRCLRKNINILDEKFVTLVLINQVRTNLKAMFGDTDSATPGGKAIPFYASVIVKLKTMNHIVDNKTKVELGVNAEAKVTKNKVAPGFRKAKFPLLYSWGIDDEKSLLDYFTDKGIVDGKIVKVFTDPETKKQFSFRGSEWSELLKTNEELKSCVKQILDKDLIMKFDKRTDLSEASEEGLVETEPVKEEDEEPEEQTEVIKRVEALNLTE